MPGGEIISTYEAAATLLAGVDAFRNDRKSSTSRHRSVEGIAIVGGNAINEAVVDVMAGDYFFGRFRNTLNGAVAIRMPEDYQAIKPGMLPAGDRLVATIVIAPTVSPLIIKVFGREY